MTQLENRRKMEALLTVCFHGERHNASKQGIDGLVMDNNSPASAAPDLDEISEERLLLERLRGIEDDLTGVYSIHIRLSALRPGNRKPHFTRIAVRAFDFVTENFDATLYEFSNCDLLLLCNYVPIEEVDPSISKVRALFSEDPLTKAEEGSKDDIFATWYDLAQEEDYENFIALITDLEAEAEERRKRTAEDKAAEKYRYLPGVPLDPSNLAAINDIMSESRISDLIQLQSAIQIKPKAKGKLLFREHYVSMTGLQKRVAPDVNLFGSVWLFQYLTETLDRRVLAVIGRRDFSALDSPISLNLNLSTILSKEFQKFHQSVEENAFKVVVELQMIDIFTDMGGYFYARDFLKELGYRVLVDGVNPLSLQYFKPGVLKADFVKIGWGREFLSEIPGANKNEMQDVMDRTGKSKIILGRVDTEKAVEWALNFGISRFQGHYIDTIVDAMRAKEII